MSLKQKKTASFVSAAQAITKIKAGQRIFVHGAAMTPNILLDALNERRGELTNTEIVAIHTEGLAPYLFGEESTRIFHRSLFCGQNIRASLKTGEADYVPVFLSDIPLLFRQRVLPIDVALITVSPPDTHGYCSLGASVDIAVAAVECAKLVIAVVNTEAPRTHGDGVLHISKIDYLVEATIPLWCHKCESPTQTELKIGEYVASLIDDGATLQMGIGGVPNAVLKLLSNHRRLGIHTEMFSDGILDLVEQGVITGELKRVLPNRITTSFVMGSKRVFDFINDNPIIAMKETAYTNDTSIIRQNPKVVAINSAIEVDLTGQVCADSIGTSHYSGVGGQLDFMRGACLSDGGKAIIALPSTTSNGDSKIVSILKPGAGVTTTRAHVRYIVTEYGIADLFGLTLRERAKALINIAHPNHRELLLEAATCRFKKLKDFADLRCSGGL
jgi:acyl-CoA hydrolase